MSSALTADVLVLKNGSVIEGEYLNEDRNGILFRVQESEKYFPVDTIQEIKLSYDGASACYRLINTTQIRCADRLYLYSEQALYFARAPQFVEIYEVPITQVAALKIERDSTDRNMADYLPLEQTIELQLADETQTRVVTVRSVEASRISVADSTSGRLSAIAPDSIERIVYPPGGMAALQPDNEISPERHAYAFHPVDLYPGVHRLRAGDYWSGAGLAGVFSLALTRAYLEKRAADQTARNAAQDLSVFILLNRSYEHKFTRHQRNQRNAGYLALAVYCIHLIDLWAFNSSTSNSDNESTYPPEERNGFFWNVDFTAGDAWMYDPFKRLHATRFTNEISIEREYAEVRYQGGFLYRF